MTFNGHDEHRGRETRLLLLVIVIAFALLFVLAEFQFPAADRPVVAVPPSPAPLERLAARNTLDEVGGTIEGLTERLTPWLAVVRTDPPASPKARSRNAAPAEPADVHWAPAVRVRPDLGLVYVAPARTIGLVIDAATPVETVAADQAREVALVRLPFAEGVSMPAAFENFEGFSYVAVIEAGAGGISARPLFLGRVTRVSDPRWSEPVLVLAGRPGVMRGDLIFSFGGLFIGIAIEHADGLALVPPSALEAGVAAMLGGGGIRVP
jgi:hypothetical protein